MSKQAKTIFTYLYRDAGNYKAWGELLLDGVLSSSDVEEIQSRFEGSEYFIAEQLGIPTLYQTLWDECESGPSSDDHVWHEFSGFRIASDEDMAILKSWGSTAKLLRAVTSVTAWDETLSSNWNC
ncbi:hypothetical protein [Chitinimonas sp.]|uniref:hypothetical protein n=1 Tax=Chitinimonas sp. TaxID=1934313 RepID=UPI0035B44745